MWVRREVVAIAMVGAALQRVSAVITHECRTMVCGSKLRNACGLTRTSPRGLPSTCGEMRTERGPAAMTLEGVASRPLAPLPLPFDSHLRSLQTSSAAPLIRLLLERRPRRRSHHVIALAAPAVHLPVSGDGPCRRRPISCVGSVGPHSRILPRAVCGWSPERDSCC